MHDSPCPTPLPHQHLQQSCKVPQRLLWALRDTSSAHYCLDTSSAGGLSRADHKYGREFLDLALFCCQQFKICAEGEMCVHVLDVSDVHVGKRASNTAQNPATYGCFTGEFPLQFTAMTVS